MAGDAQPHATTHCHMHSTRTATCTAHALPHAITAGATWHAHAQAVGLFCRIRRSLSGAKWHAHAQEAVARTGGCRELKSSVVLGLEFDNGGKHGNVVVRYQCLHIAFAYQSPKP